MGGGCEALLLPQPQEGSDSHRPRVGFEPVISECEHLGSSAATDRLMKFDVYMRTVNSSIRNMHKPNEIY